MSNLISIPGEYFVNQQGEVFEHGVSPSQYNPSTCTTIEGKVKALTEAVRRLEVLLAERKRQLEAAKDAEAPKKQPLAFKFGDKVKVDGRLGVIVSVDPDDEPPYEVAFKEGDLWDWFHADKVKADTGYDFAVGDRVRITKVGADHFGEVGTVKEVDTDDKLLPYRVEFADDYNWFEVGEVSAASEASFGLGDKVRYLMKYTAHSDDVATVEVMHSDTEYTIVFEDGCRYRAESYNLAAEA